MKKKISIAYLLFYFSLFCYAEIIGDTLSIDLSKYKQYGSTYQNKERTIEILPIFENMELGKCVEVYKEKYCPNEHFKITTEEAFGDDKKYFEVQSIFTENEPKTRIYFIGKRKYTCILVVSYISHLIDKKEIDDINSLVSNSIMYEKVPQIGKMPNYSVKIASEYSLEMLNGNNWRITKENDEISASYIPIRINVKIRDLAENMFPKNDLCESKKICNGISKNVIWFTKYKLDQDKARCVYFIKKDYQTVMISIISHNEKLKSQVYTKIARSIIFF